MVGALALAHQLVVRRQLAQQLVVLSQRLSAFFRS